VSEFILLKASAGSGKTYRLAERFLSFLLTPAPDPRVGRDLRNILAITFTNNAAREMKGRILGWLKECGLRDPDRIRELSAAIRIPPDRLPRLAAAAVETILDEYTDFQVTTIDSFITAVFRASAVDLGALPDFEVVLDQTELVDYAFSRYLRTVKPGSPPARDFERILDDLFLYRKKDAAFLWDPTSEVLAKLSAFYAKFVARAGDVVVDPCEKARAAVLRNLRKTVDAIDAEIASSGLEPNPASPYWTRDVGGAVRSGRTCDLVGRVPKKGPVKKPGTPGGMAAFARIEASMDRLRDQLSRYGSIYARDFFTPYLEAYRRFLGALTQAKRRRGEIFLEDMARGLAGYLNLGVVPDVYIRLGDRIFHYLVDEFQDTSPIQWADLKPLIEESLSKGGTLFLVGDAKQAIYGFRDADYEIMRNLELRVEGFGPAEVDVQELKTNWRSRSAVLEFAKRTFLQLGADKAGRAAAGVPPAPPALRDKYSAYAELSGLDDFEQNVRAGLREPGLVDYTVFQKKKDEEEADDVPSEDEAGGPGEAEDGPPEKLRVQDLIARLRERGYDYGDIAVLTATNASVVRTAAWLNEKKIPFVPFSSLDIRLRKVIREILALLRFLDSPPDDLSFAAFLLGDLLRRRIERDREILARSGSASGPDDLREFLFDCRREKAAPLYTAFRKRRPVLWDRYFERCFRSVGYFPLYDLVTLVFRVFDVYDLFPEDEAALTRLLETIKDLEGRGRNDIFEFLALSASDGEAKAWTVDVAREISAVRVMTVHKAKGLGFPVVILLLDGRAWRPPDFYIQEKDDGIRIYKITSALAAADPELAGVYAAQKAKDWVGLLNMLYVAVTRARAELYIVGVKGPRSGFPFDLIEAGLPPSAGPPSRTAPALRDRPCEPSPQAGRLRLSGLFEPPSNTRTGLNYRSLRRGEIAHRILAGLESVEAGGWDAAVAAEIGARVPAEPEAALYAEVGKTIAAALAGSPAEDLFARKPGRRILREFDFADSRGRVYRMDRVVVDPETVVVLDFKTGTRPGDEDRAQVRSYAAILKEVYPGRTVRACLAYLDSRTLEFIE
jgi:ATP-dependent exoDNAse (exonuclease V) beta subunit